MPQTIHVVQYNTSTDLYLIFDGGTYENCRWGNLGEAIQYETLEDAEEVAERIGGGTVGTTKPNP